MTDHHDPTDQAWRPSRRRLAERARAIAQARWFALTVFSLTFVNAALLGVETYSGVIEDWHQWLRLAEHLCLAAFTVEILLRACAHADRPRDFFRDPWNGAHPSSPHGGKQPPVQHRSANERGTESPCWNACCAVLVPFAARLAAGAGDRASRLPRVEHTTAAGQGARTVSSAGAGRSIG